MTTLSPELEATYEVLGTMGGGMGAVYKVRHRLFGEIRILKVMQAELKNDSSLRERFSAEAKRGKQLKHRNIAEVLDFLIGSDGNAYLVIEYIDGVNLREAFSQTEQPLDPRTVVAIGEQTLAALGYIHDRNLIHRDISPENLMVTKDEDGCLLIKLIDLGIAKSLEETITLTRAGDFMGKLSYASPEQFGEKVDTRSDFYSLGIVLYELLTRFKPITAANTSAFVLAHYQTPPRPFSETDPSHRIPETLRQVVLKALEKKPENRYQTAGEFAAALHATLLSPDMPAAAPSPAVLPPPPASTRPNLTPVLVPTLPSSLGQALPSSLPINAPSVAAPTEIIRPTPTSSKGVWLFIAVAALLVIVAGVGFAAFKYLHRPAASPATPNVPVTATNDGRPATGTMDVTATESNPSPAQETASIAPAIETPPVSTQTVESTTSANRPPATTTDRPVSSTHGNITDVGRPVTATTGTTPTTATASSSPPATPRPDLAEGDRQRKQALAFSNAHQWQNAVNAWWQFIHVYSGINPAADHAAYYNLGVAYESLQNWREGADAFEQAASANNGGSDTNNLVHLARCYGKLGRWSDAAATYERVLKIDPQNENAKRNLPIALQRVGQ